MSEDSCENLRVEYEGATYELRPGETLLDAFLRGGANVSFSCRRGTCQVCMLQATRGDPGPAARADLREELHELGLFLACQARPREELVVVKPDLRELVIDAHVLAHEPLSPSVTRIELAPETSMSWRAGQFITVEHPSGALRSYSLASLYEQGEQLVLHVRRSPGGLVSGWLCDELGADDVLKIRGPCGACFYDADLVDRELLLVAGGTGLAPLMGIARDALSQEQRGRVTLLHGVVTAEEAYRHDQLMALAAEHDNFFYEAWVDEPGASPLPPGMSRGSVVEA
jgi:NAD(P)H-flavin reductase